MQTTIDRSAVEAMHNRAKQLVLTQAWLGKAGGLSFAQGALGAYAGLLNSEGAAFGAARDASLGGYQPLAGFEAAWAALPASAKHFTLAKMQEFLRAHGVEVAPDAVANGNVDQSKMATLVSSPCVGSAVEQGFVFIEHIPRNAVDVECESTDQAAYGGRPENDAVIGQRLHDAIIEAQLVGARLVRYVEPQNLLFVFSESLQSLKQITLELPLFENTTTRDIDGLDNPNTQERPAQQQANPNNRAIVLCHILDAQCLQQLTGGKKQEGQNSANCYDISWSELQRLKDLFEKFSGHKASVGGAA